MNFQKQIASDCALALQQLYNIQIEANQIALQKTRKEFEGDFTLVVFPFIKQAAKGPEQCGNEIGSWLIENSKLVKSFNVVKGFLNLVLHDALWISFLKDLQSTFNYGFVSPSTLSQHIMIEYPSPNTNKPLHLGHLRNIFLGSSLSEILKSQGHTVIHSCLYNDRGTNISKSMLAWKLFANGETPETYHKKGDHLVGEYYVKYANAYKAEIEKLIEGGLTKEEAEKKSELAAEVNNLTVKWEAGDKETRELWKMMNGWVYKGFDETYRWLGIKPDKFYYESDVYNLGKETVEEGLKKGIFYRKDDGSVWIDLTADGLDEKLVLRSNGTTVYITQDIAVANEKEKDFKIDRSIYVVGNEQDYHFKVLFLILKKLGRTYADNLFHLSYGMVELPSGKMKSREGTVVDADDLINEMVDTAEATTRELGKIDGFSEDEAKDLYRTIGLGALKYFILKVDPKKKMLFDPNESVDFNGHTGPFIQYTHARIRSVLRKAEENQDSLSKKALPNDYSLHDRERDLLRSIYEFPEIIAEAAQNYSPALLANYVYELVKQYNGFYHDLSINKAERTEEKDFRLVLSWQCANIIRNGMKLLCIDVPERM